MTRRVTVTLKLQPGVDDDLILWWQSLPRGKGQAEVKRLLCDALHIPDPKASPLETYLKQIEANIQEMQHMIKGLSASLLIRDQPSSSDEAPRGDTPALSAGARERRGHKIARSQW